MGSDLQLFNLFMQTSGRQNIQWLRVMFFYVGVLLPGILVSSAQAQNADTTTLWGQAGELWNPFIPTSRLPDFSYAGYHSGEAELPAIDQRLDITDPRFGAIPNDGIDDSHAIQAALNSVAPGQAVYLPNGRYLIRELLIVEDKGDWVLQGESKDGVILFIDLPGSQLGREDIDGSNQGFWSYDGAFIWVKGSNSADSSTKIGSIVTTAVRGQRQLRISGKVDVEAGEWVQIVATDPPAGPDQGSLQKHLHQGLHERLDAAELYGKQLLRFPTRLSDVSGRIVTLERPLPINLQLAWQPELHYLRPSVEEVGIENLTIEFEHSPYLGHFQELGYNAIILSGVAHSWVRNVQVNNADIGIALVNDSMFTTIKDVVVGSEENRNLPDGSLGNWNGHHAILVSRSYDNLIANFEISARYVHDLSVTWFDRGNVFTSGSGVNINLDHHRAAAYQNLFTEINVGLASRVFESGGKASRGPHSGAYNTYWNINGVGEFVGLKCDFGGGRLNFVAVAISVTCSGNDWFLPDKDIDPLHVYPPNLYDAQVDFRLGQSLQTWSK